MSLLKFAGGGKARVDAGNCGREDRRDHFLDGGLAVAAGPRRQSGIAELATPAASKRTESRNARSPLP